MAITGASNLVGTRPDVERVAAAAHAVGALVHVDDSHVLGAPDKGMDLLEPVLDRGRIALAAEMLGSSLAASL